MNEMVEALLPAQWRGTWLVTTEHGTQTYFDFDDGLWMRVPAQRLDRETNRLARDHCWVRLGFGPYSVRVGETEHPAGIRVGWRVHYGLGVRDDLYSTIVTSIQRVEGDEVPGPNTPSARFYDPAEVPEPHRRPEDEMGAWEIGGGWDIDVGTTSGPTLDSVLVSFADALDEWLDEQVERGEAGRTVRVWRTRRDSEGSVLTWLRAHVVVEED